MENAAKRMLKAASNEAESGSPLAVTLFNYIKIAKFEKFEKFFKIFNLNIFNIIFFAVGSLGVFVNLFFYYIY